MKLNWNALLYSVATAGLTMIPAALSDSSMKVIVCTGLLSFFTTFRAYLQPPGKQQEGKPDAD